MNKLHTITAEDLQNRTYDPTPFLVDELIPEGLHILAGAPKIGKLNLKIVEGSQIYSGLSLDDLEYSSDQKYTALMLIHAIDEAVTKAEAD